MLVAVAIGSTLMAALVIAAMCCTCPEPEQPSPEQTQRAALAALAAAVPVPKPSSTAQLPCFPYAAAQGGRVPETLVCAICLEPLRRGELCSEVPACGRVFHGNCVATWARSKGSCPLCRAKIVPGSARGVVADDMV